MPVADKTVSGREFSAIYCCTFQERAGEVDKVKVMGISRLSLRLRYFMGVVRVTYVTVFLCALLPAAGARTDHPAGAARAKVPIAVAAAAPSTTTAAAALASSTALRLGCRSSPTSLMP